METIKLYFNLLKPYFCMTLKNHKLRFRLEGTLNIELLYRAVIL